MSAEKNDYIMQHGFGFVKIIVYLVWKCNKNIVLFPLSHALYRLWASVFSVVHQHHPQYASEDAEPQKVYVSACEFLTCIFLCFQYENTFSGPPLVNTLKQSNNCP